MTQIQLCKLDKRISQTGHLSLGIHFLCIYSHVHDYSNYVSLIVNIHSTSSLQTIHNLTQSITD